MSWIKKLSKLRYSMFAALLLAGLCEAQQRRMAIAELGSETANGGSPNLRSLSASTDSNVPNGKPLGDHYLMLVNTAIARLLKPAEITEFDKSPYDGLAISFHYNYDTAPVFSPEMMSAQLLEWQKLTKKHLWPWVYINRMIGAGEAATNDRTNVPYFHKIQGIDLEDKVGARNDFFQIWQNALRTAKTTKAPGVLLDLEFYNYHKEYDPAEMASQTGKPVQQVVTLLEQLGARLADIANGENPGAVLWLPFTGFTHEGFKLIDGKSYYPTPVYIVVGLLDQVQKQHYRLTVISGGEGSLGYCHDSVMELQASIQKRAASFAPQLQKYSGILELAGTMTVWNERAGKSGFIAEDGCATATAQTIEDLQPYLEVLLKTYRYNWIYGSSNGSYFAFDPRSAPRFNAVIGRARRNVEGSNPH